MSNTFRLGDISRPAPLSHITDKGLKMNIISVRPGARVAIWGLGQGWARAGPVCSHLLRVFAGKTKGC